jgi:hypothetical protein
MPIHIYESVYDINARPCPKCGKLLGEHGPPDPMPQTYEDWRLTGDFECGVTTDELVAAGLLKKIE